MASAVVESSGGRYEAESHMKITSSFLAHLRAGCVCSIPNVQFAAYIVEGCQLLREESRSTTTSRRQRLCFLTFLRALTKLSMLVTSSMDEKHVMCKRLRTWLLVMRKIKLYLLAGLAQLLNDHQNGRHLLHMTQSTFNHILALFPCPLISPNPEESCRKLCKQLVQHYTAQIRHSTHLSSRSSLAIVSFCQLELQISNMKKGLQMDCQTAKMAVIPSNHIKSFNKNLLQSLRVSWKPWVDLVLNCDDVLFKHQTLTLWRSLVDVKSNMTLHQARDFVSSVCTLVETLPCESDALIKRKWLSILCEVLCYGSTLGIQSDVPSEVSEIAHKLLRQSRSESFNVYEVPNVYPGMAGNRAIPTEENDEMDQVPDLVILQGVVLIHLKAVALLVREAQCCSSSDESDSSLSSRGSGSVAEEEREMRMIEKNVIELLSKMRAWINDTLGLPSSSSLISGVTTLFNEQVLLVYFIVFAATYINNALHSRMMGLLRHYYVSLTRILDSSLAVIRHELASHVSMTTSPWTFSTPSMPLKVFCNRYPTIPVSFWTFSSPMRHASYFTS
jgi:hypothetical protein